MDTLTQFEMICRAMANPDFYAHPVTTIERRDTHISSVFLTGQWVYKLKKPVDFGFLDFRNLDDRRRFCELEITLNQRLSHNIYHEVIKIYENQKGCFSLQKNGPVVEYAVKMKQLSDSVNLKELLKNNKIQRTQLQELGHRLSNFYKSSEQNAQIDHYGRKEVIAFNMEENFRQLEPFIDADFDRKKWEYICQANRAFIENNTDLFRHRLQTGHIRDGHGDLRAEHVYFYQGVQIIDCIEFNKRFRYGDVAVDLAYLYMDMEHLGYPELSRAFLFDYVKDSNDPELYLLLDFYAAYRAVVRLKVSCFRLSEVKSPEREAVIEEARRYMDLAYRYSIQFSRPTLWIFCGLPATGKSRIAEQAAKTLSISLFQSDHVRKEKQSEPHQEIVPFGQGLYRQEKRNQVYQQLLSLAEKKLGKGQSVILDATYSNRSWRESARRLADQLKINLIFVECVCKEETIRSRLQQREDQDSFSDARLQHLQEMLKNFQPLDELPSEMHLTINTEQSFETEFIELLSEGHARICAQSEKSLE